MTITFDVEADAAYLKFMDAEITRTHNKGHGIIVDYDKEDEVVGIELLSISAKIEKSEEIQLPMKLLNSD